MAMVGEERSRDQFFAIYYVEHADLKAACHIAVPIRWAKKSTVKASHSLWKRFVTILAVSILKPSDPDFAHPLLNPRIYLNISPIAMVGDGSEAAISKFMNAEFARIRDDELSHDRALINALIVAARTTGEGERIEIAQEFMDMVEAGENETEDDGKSVWTTSGDTMVDDDTDSHDEDRTKVTQKEKRDDCDWMGTEWYEVEDRSDDKK